MERGFKVCEVLMHSLLCGLRNRIVAGASSDTPTMIPNSVLSLCQPIPAPARYSLTPTENVTDETIETYLRPFLASKHRTRDLERFVEAFDNKHTVAIEPKLKTLKARTLIVLGTDDIYFDVKWSHWLADAIPGTARRVELKGARIFFPEERPEEFNRELRGFWKQTE